MVSVLFVDFIHHSTSIVTAARIGNPQRISMVGTIVFHSVHDGKCMLGLGELGRRF